MSTKVSVISSVYNQEKYINKSIESILCQSFEDFEFLIADDKSTDNTRKILESYKDKRIKVIQNEKNIGLTKSLNNLLENSIGSYVARIDLDDVCDPKRLENQVRFLDENQDFGMVSSCYDAIGEQGNKIYSHCPALDPVELKWSLIFRNNIRHSTVMWRKSLNEKYEESFRYAQDYDLWCKFARKTNIGVLNEITTSIRCHENAITKQFYLEQEFFATNITKKQFEFYVGKPISLKEAKDLRLFYYLKDEQQFKQFEKMTKNDLMTATKKYLDVLNCFIKQESKDFINLENEVQKDIESIKQRPDKKEDLLESIKIWFAEQMDNKIGIMEEKYLKTSKSAKIFN